MAQPTIPYAGAQGLLAASSRGDRGKQQFGQGRRGQEVGKVSREDALTGGAGVIDGPLPVVAVGRSLGLVRRLVERRGGRAVTSPRFPGGAPSSAGPRSPAPAQSVLGGRA